MYVHDWYYDPDNLEKRIAYEKKRSKTPERKMYKFIGQQMRRKRSPGKNRARAKVSNAIRNGRSKRGKCEICGATKTEAHHDDYRKYLQVRWLCRKHHMNMELKRSWT